MFTNSGAAQKKQHFKGFFEQSRALFVQKFLLVAARCFVPL
jgi:hypothetical protein